MFGKTSSSNEEREPLLTLYIILFVYSIVIYSFYPVLPQFLVSLNLSPRLELFLKVVTTVSLYSAIAILIIYSILSEKISLRKEILVLGYATLMYAGIIALFLEAIDTAHTLEYRVIPPFMVLIADKYGEVLSLSISMLIAFSLLIVSIAKLSRTGLFIKISRYIVKLIEKTISRCKQHY